MTSYASCWWLHDHLEFGPAGEVHACCYQYSNAKGEVHGGSEFELCRITGNTFPAAEIAAARQRVHETLATGYHGDCSECPELKTKNWRTPKYLTRSLTMNVWTHCNLKCRYCFTTVPGFKYSKVKYPLVEVIADMLAGEHLDPNGTVTWGGGDISALVEFNDLSRMFLAYGVKQDFKTSAYKFLPGVAETIAKDKGAVEVSVDAGTRETYASYKGEDVYDRVVENIGRYRESGPIKLKYIAAACNISDADIDGFVDLAKRTKPISVMVTPEYGESWAKEYDHKAIRQIAKLINKLMASGHDMVPSNAVDGRRIFPDFWEALAPLLSMNKTPSVFEKIRMAFRS
jgi:sulfatase maturation enzyme AslB (radical SAM superfamily)